MATARKLPSGSWRCLAYSHTEETIDPNTGQKKKKKIYVSFTSSDPTSQGRREAELAAKEFQTRNSSNAKKKLVGSGSMTLGEAIDQYIKIKEASGRSVTTINDYKITRKYAFQDIMDLPLRELTSEIIQSAVDAEAIRTSDRKRKEKKPISVKRLRNEYGLLASTLHKYRSNLKLTDIELPKASERVVELPSAKKVMQIVKGTDIELPVLLAMWLSFSMSEIKGLTKSKSLSPDGNYISIREVAVTVNGKQVTKSEAKVDSRKRRHRLPAYIKDLIDKVDGDIIVPKSGHAIYMKWIRLQEANHMDPITFHDLRHLSASVMALLRVPDKYAQERGGWKSDQIMKRVYQNTFSEERIKVDDMIDQYFEEYIQHEIQHAEK